MSELLGHSVLKTGNSRFLYKDCFALSGEEDSVINSLISFVDNSAQLQRANENYYFYYFSPPTDAHFSMMDSWVGLEVIGIVDIPEEIEDIDVMDLDHSFVISIPIGIYDKKTGFLTQAKLSELYSLAYKKLLSMTLKNVFPQIQEEGNSALKLAETWRLRMSEMDCQIKMEFFLVEF